MIFIDTGAFVARYVKRNQYHDRAVEHWQHMQDAIREYLEGAVKISKGAKARELTNRRAAYLGKQICGFDKRAVGRIILTLKASARCWIGCPEQHGQALFT